MNAPARRKIPAGVTVATFLIALNVLALALAREHPYVAWAAVALDLGGIGVLLWLAWRQSQRMESALESGAREQRLATERVQATLADAEARHAAILESAMDAVITTDGSQHVILFNRAAEQMFGCTRKEAIGGPLGRFLPQRYRQAHAGHVEAFGRAGITNRRMGHNTVLTALRTDGTEFPIEASISRAGDGADQHFTVIVRDITLRQSAEDALRQSQVELRELSAEVLQAREDEKTRIARELHDELGQQLTALKMDLAWTRERLPAHLPELAQKLTRMNATLDATVGATRRISADLRPLMLDDLGLAEAAEWLVEDFGARSGIACTLALERAEAVSALARPTATALYRALQESLTNVARHAAAGSVRVRLAADSREAVLSVEDDGHGIDEADRRKPRSFGLKGLRERAHYLGGTALVERIPEGGTRVLVRIPLAAAQIA